MPLAVLGGRAQASSLHCGDTLGAGSYVLETDLDCDSLSGSGVGLYLTSGANLDLGGHTLRMTIAGSGNTLDITGTGVQVHDGTLRSAERAVSIQGGGHHHLSRLQITYVNSGIVLQNTRDNVIADSQIDAAAIFGVYAEASTGNRFERLVINDTNGIGPAAGIQFVNSDGNVITQCKVSGSLCTGIALQDSNQNWVSFNGVQGSFSFFKGGPAVNVLVLGSSSKNLIFGNQVSSTAPGTDDGINVGCRDTCVCGFQTPTTGASGNLVFGNRANHEDRYGFAQAPGNPGNLFFFNQAQGNGVANYALGP